MAARPQKLNAIVCAVALICAASPLRLPDTNATAAALQGPDAARRVVSLVPNVTEILFAVGAGGQVVAVSSYDDFPPQAKSLPRVGALLDPDVERILALRPDLVMVYGSQSKLEGQLARAGIRVYSYRHAGVDNVLMAIRDVGRLTGHATESERVVRDLQSQLDGLRARVRGYPRPRTMLVIGRDAGALRGVYTSGGVGFLHELLDAAGGDDVFADIKREAVQPSNETMIVRAPQAIIELHAAEQPAAEVLRRERAVWNALPSIPAVRNNRVHLLYGSYLMAAGPRLGRAAEALARVLHPEGFR
jgi:iron complex transport system substrate-binding protein